MKKKSKSTLQFGYVCSECPTDKCVHSNPKWTTKQIRDKSMENHTKKTGHSMFARTITEYLN